jgi:hypothetical protein
MYQSPPPNCFSLVHYVNGKILFSCLPFPHIQPSIILHYILLALLIIAVLAIFLTIIYISKQLLLLKIQTSEKYTLLEITPPSDTNQTPLSTEQFITNLNTIGNQPSTLDIILGKKKTFTLELVSTKDLGIRYLLRVPATDESIARRQIISFLPNAKITTTKEYLSELKQKKFWQIKELVLANHFAFPLQEQNKLSQFDPVAYFTGHMTQLAPDEIILFQLIISPVTKQVHKEETSFVHKANYQIAKGNDVMQSIKNHHTLLHTITTNIFLVIPFIILSPLTIVEFFLSGNKKADFLPFWLFRKQAKENFLPLTPQQQEVQQKIHQKINSQLYEVSIRLFCLQNNKKAVSERIQGFLSSIKSFHSSDQSFKIKPFSSIKKNYDYFKLHNRLLSMHNNPILSVSELSSLFHFPYFTTTKTEDLVNIRSITLPAPLHFKQSTTKLDVTFGINDYANKKTIIGLTKNERYRHTYINGKTGAGKTTMLSTMIHQDIQNGKGLAILDPHGELIQMMLGRIPKERIKDVIYFNPQDRSLPLGLNILELPKNLTEEQREEAKDIIASSIISIFHKIYDEKYLGPRMENILRFTILTALETDNPTLFTVKKLLTDNRYRARIIKTLKDPVVKDFWIHEFKGHGSFQQSDMTSPINSKLGQFLSSSLCRYILGQTHSSIDFENVLNEEKILLCNLSKGGIGEDNSKFLGTLIAAKIQLAALKREKIPTEQRRDFYLYIDEFQNFALPSFAQMMSESRKYKVYGIWAHQTIAQLKDHDLTKVILANTGTVICFATLSPFDEEFLLPIFTPHLKAGDLMNLPAFSSYIKINAIQPYDTFSAKVEPLRNPYHETIAQEIIKYSRVTYGRPKQKIKEQIESYYLKIPKNKTTASNKEEEQKGNKKTTKEIEKQTKETKSKGNMDEE